MIDFFKPKYKCDVPIIWLTIILMIIVLMCSCSANWHIKRAIKKDPNILKADTMYVHDTLVVPEMIIEGNSTINIDTIYLDSIIKADCPEAPKRLRNELIKIKYINLDTTISTDKYKLSILIENGILKYENIIYQQTKIVEKKIPYKKIEYKPRAWYDTYWWLILLGCGALIYFKK